MLEHLRSMARWLSFKNTASLSWSWSSSPVSLSGARGRGGLTFSSEPSLSPALYGQIKSGGWGCGVGEREVKMVNARGNLKVAMMFPSGQGMQKHPRKVSWESNTKRNETKPNLLESGDTSLEGRVSHGCQSKYKANILPVSSGQEAPPRLGSKSLLEAALCKRQGWRPGPQAHPCRRH